MTLAFGESIGAGRLKALKWFRKQRRAKPPFAGILTPRALAAWLIRRPSDTLDVLPQLIDKMPIGRPVSDRADIRQAVADLDRDGVAILERVVPPAFVEAARRDLDTFVARIPELEGTTRTMMHSSGRPQVYPVHEFQRDLNIYRSHDPLVFSPTYARFLLLPELRAVVAGYLGRNWLYQAMVATRTEPSEKQEGFARWHHDARGRKVNVILLLSDVAADGPATIVKMGSHRLVYLNARRNRVMLYDEEEAKMHQYFGWQEKVCAAPAGSLVFFDSQAYHRGRRSPDRRDAFQVNCMTKRPHLWPQEIPRALLETLSPAEQQDLLRRARLRVI